MSDQVRSLNVKKILSFFRYLFVRITFYVVNFYKKLFNGYYIKNFFERNRNRRILKQKRVGFPIPNSTDDAKPLVSVLIPTYNRVQVLVERCIPSVLNQTYQNFEIVIVGDNCSEQMSEIIRNLDDERIKFYNLPERGRYPSNPEYRWMVAGTTPRNKSIELCSGEWIAPLDDDDEFSKNHIETLLSYALENDYEMVYGKVEMELNPNDWKELGSYPLKCGSISHLSVLYHSKLKFFKYDVNAWKYEEPADWNMWRRMNEAGVRIGFINKVVGRHYLEGTEKRG